MCSFFNLWNLKDDFYLTDCGQHDQLNAVLDVNGSRSRIRGAKYGFYVLLKFALHFIRLVFSRDLF